MEDIPVGSTEYLVVDVTDRLDSITDLTGFTITFDVIPESGGDNLYIAEPATGEGMLIRCLVDTTDWIPGHYLLYTNLDLGVEKPRLGPFDFRVG